MRIDRSSVPLVSVIIPVYNDAKRLKRCLNALEDQTYPADRYEVIVVDNGSDDPVDPVVAAYPHTRAVFEERRGSYAARNRGVRAASGTVLAFTDADCIPEPDWVRAGVAALEGIGGEGLVGGRVESFYQDLECPTAVELLDDTTYLDQEASCTRRNFAVTANMITARHVFEAVGPFDERLQSGGDREWGHRAHEQGYAVRYAPDACVRHPARHTVEAFRKKVLRVVQGQHDDRMRRGHSLRALLLDLGTLCVPPVRTLFRMLTDSRLPVAERVRAVLLLVQMRGLQIKEKIRLWVRTRRHHKQAARA